MNETLANQENNKFPHNPKLFGLPRPIAGALIGIVLFILIYLISNAAGFIILSAALLAPGIWANLMFESAMDRLPISASAYDFLSYAMAYIAAFIPPAILGSLFVSKKKEMRIIGIGLFIMYFLFSLFVALLAYAIAMH
jgi:hypothetical protein